MGLVFLEHNFLVVVVVVVAAAAAAASMSAQVMWSGVAQLM